MGNPLFARKREHVARGGQGRRRHSLKRTLGPFQLTALGVGAIIGAASLCSQDWARITLARADAFVRAFRAGLRFRRALLRRICGMIPLRQRLHLRLRHPRRLFAWIMAGTSPWNTPWEPARFPPAGQTISSSCSIFSISKCHCGWPTTLDRAAHRYENRRAPDGTSSDAHCSRARSLSR